MPKGHLSNPLKRSINGRSSYIRSRNREKQSRSSVPKHAMIGPQSSVEHACETAKPQQDPSPSETPDPQQDSSPCRLVPWKSPVEHRGHGCETPDPQQDSSPRRCQKRAQRCSRNSIFGTAKQKAIQGVQGIDGPASTMEKRCGKLWSMVAKHRIPSRIQPQTVPEACAEMLSK